MPKDEPPILAAKYRPAEHEDAVRARWDQARAFHPHPARVISGEKPPYCIFIPPPNVTARLHLGHALNNSLQDILARAHRMKGFETLWMPGTDHAGIATQSVVEQRLLKEHGKRRTDFTREQFVARVQAWKDEYEAAITDQLKALGCSCDWERQRFTMDEVCARAVREAFFRLFKDGLIYRGKRLVNWDPANQTALADDEVEMEEVDGFFYYLRYPLVRVTSGTNPRNPNAALPRKLGGLEHQPVTWDELARLGFPGAQAHAGDDQAWITVATTRPETYLGDTAVAMNPHDPRAKALRGLFCELPLVGRCIPLIADSYVVMPMSAAQIEEAQAAGTPIDPKAKFATGFLKVTPAHDPNDYEIGRRHDLKMAINVMAPDASISDKHGWSDVEDAHLFVGLSREEARKKVIQEFKARHVGGSNAPLFEKQVAYRHSVGHSYRSHVPIEPYLSDQWYCKVTDDRLRGAALRAMNPAQRSHQAIEPSSHRGNDAGDDALTFFPERYAKPYETWHENLRDWCISRQLWWGHQIPVWTVSLSTQAMAGSPASPVQTVEESVARETAYIAEKASLFKDIARTCGIDPDGELAITHGQNPEFMVAARTERAARFLDSAAAFLVSETIQKGDGEPGKPLPGFQGTETAGRKLGHLVHKITRDPDVLDTWFSSALWPMSTLGWPEPPADMKGLLEAFNPSSVLATAREIITLWVSRMVMFNRYFMPESWPRGADGAGGPIDQGGQGNGPVPFRHVYINAVVQDGHGQRMSKSLGNGVDPLDIIHSHGTDALRWVLTQTATGTQDVRLPVDLSCPHCAHAFEPAWVTSPAGYKVAAPTQTCPSCKKQMVSAYGASSGSAKPSDEMPLARNSSTKFDAGRNFCTKLWNATKFAMMNLEPASAAQGQPAPPADAPLALIDRWMLSRLARTVQAVDEALASYQFATYSTALYDLFWRDFCDWYLEGIKPTIKSSPAQQGVLRAALDTILRLLHPVCPYISEQLFTALRGTRAPAVKGLELGEADLLCLAPWPRAEAVIIDENAEALFERQRGLVEAVRELRAAKGVEPKRRPTLHVWDELARMLESSGSLVQTLAQLGRVTSEPAPAGAATLLLEGREAFLSDYADAPDEGSERETLLQTAARLEKEIATLTSRLANPGYAAKAPPKLVDETRATMAQKQRELDSARARLAQLA